jgi:zinc transport system substrate-binding protein
MRAILTIIAFLGAGASPACDSSGASSVGRPLVVASFYPLAEAAQRIGGDAVDVVNLTPAGVEPHDLELAPDDVVRIAEADVVLFVGGGFQPALEGALGEISGDAVDVLEGVATLPPPDGETASGSIDPHVWLDPGLYERVVGIVAEALDAVAPSSASTFNSNADAFDRELEQLAVAYESGLAKCRSRVIVVSHAAFGYLSSAYDLRQEPIAGISPESEPNPRRFAELRDFVRREGVTTVFTEELAPPDIARALADETGVQTAVLNPLEGLTDEELAAGENYVSVMMHNLEVLRDGLGCR